MSEQKSASPTGDSRRQRWMSVLAKARLEHLERRWDDLGMEPRFEWLRIPETGMVMVQARAGGSGERFNFGEITVTRCALRLESGAAGLSYVAGRSKRHAELAALCDALMQTSQHQHAVNDTIIEPLSRQSRDDRDRDLRKAAATRVEFFTMARGEDPK